MSTAAEREGMAAPAAGASSPRNRRLAVILAGFAAALFLGSILFVALGR